MGLVVVVFLLLGRPILSAIVVNGGGAAAPVAGRRWTDLKPGSQDLTLGRNCEGSMSLYKSGEQPFFGYDSQRIEPGTLGVGTPCRPIQTTNGQEHRFPQRYDQAGSSIMT